MEKQVFSCIYNYGMTEKFGIPLGKREITTISCVTYVEIYRWKSAEQCD